MEFQFADLYEALTDDAPDADVLVAGEVRHTRAALDARANRLAHHLDGRGVVRGDRVAVYSFNRAEWVETLLACWKLGAAVVNVNYRYVEDELRYVLSDSEPRALVYERGLTERVANVADDVPTIG
jgi:acyl-CoA synthetase (AMP-forming)/AMP-acid ligase II